MRVIKSLNKKTYICYTFLTNFKKSKINWFNRVNNNWYQYSYWLFLLSFFRFLTKKQLWIIKKQKYRNKKEDHQPFQRKIKKWISFDCQGLRTKRKEITDGSTWRAIHAKPALLGGPEKTFEERERPWYIFIPFFFFFPSQSRKYSLEAGILASGTFLARSCCYWQGIHIRERPHAIRSFFSATMKTVRSEPSSSALLN